LSSRKKAFHYLETFVFHLLNYIAENDVKLKMISQKKQVENLKQHVDFITCAECIEDARLSI
jgi:hypothetical protein